MSRKPVIGSCRICGAYGKLSFEHVPPRSAFNDTKLKRFGFDQIFDKGPENLPTTGGRIEQRGAGGYTLCERCNNTTGSWYADHFAQWTYEGMRLLAMSGGNNLTLAYPFMIFPLRVIKQIVAMFFSVVHPEFRQKHFELERFVLHQESKHLPSPIKIYCAFMTGKWARSSGITAIGRIKPTGGLDTIVMSEIAFPPFVYVMTVNSPPPDDRLTDMSWFSTYDFNEFDIVYPRFNVLPINYYFPGDYRTVEQMIQDRINNEMGIDDL